MGVVTFSKSLDSDLAFQFDQIQHAFSFGGPEKSRFECLR